MLKRRNLKSNRSTIKVKVLSHLRSRVDEEATHEVGLKTRARHEIVGNTEY